MSQTRANAIIKVTTNTDLSAYVGCPIRLVHSVNGPRAVLWEDEEYPFGVILSADTDSVSVAPFSGGYSGTFLVKVHEDSLPGDRLYCVNSAGVVGFGGESTQGFPHVTFFCAVALELGMAGEMIEAIPRPPDSVSVV
jgi:hypothetical protein